MARHWSLLGEGPQVAARQMAMFFVFLAVLSAVALQWAPPQRHPYLAAVLLTGAVLAPIAWCIPWHRFDARTPLVPAAALVYLPPRLAGGPLPPRLVHGALFLCVMAGVGVMIARQVERERRTHEALRRSHGETQRAERWRTAREALGYLTCPVAIEMDDGSTVYADPERLEQILVNLATNAARHGKPPIIIGAEPVGGMVAICVRDHGPGVPEPPAGVLFSRFR
ncbi:hypothetical protein GCM10010466_25830 [Planomonospora alba]|uniref:Sensor-like histidine kinase SenX3 n=1 Tax=Planomonospora alba TaxID=161354 RepID=A0ABP6N3I3_9ACTN